MSGNARPEMDWPHVEKILAEHAEWTSGFFRWVFEQAFLHGYKHGWEDAMNVK